MCALARRQRYWYLHFVLHISHMNRSSCAFFGPVCMHVLFRIVLIPKHGVARRARELVAESGHISL